ncbi:MAG TPA: hypothetical protein PK156_15415 [Polyangium sp.]|nr:hypothetical protein [Polyangium sp.]
MLASRKWLGSGATFGLLVLVNCSATPASTTFETGGSGGEASGGGNTGNTTGQGGNGGMGGGFIPPTGSGGGGPTDGCSDAAKLVYVLSDANDLYSFDPPSKKFTLIGQLGCNTNMNPNSMAIDRNATAWVNYFRDGFNPKGVIYKVSTKDASCEGTPAVNLPLAWRQLGMGFSVNAAGTTDETLYVNGTSGTGLGQITATNTLMPIADFSPSTFQGETAELTGTGDGRLYGYFQTAPVYVAQIDKATGAVTNEKVITGLDTPSAWAFSFWGGSFYLYASSSGSNSTVTKYDPATGAIDNNYVSDTGMRIVGAGVSTCAPLEPPK